MLSVAALFTFLLIAAPQAPQSTPASRLRVFLDCASRDCFQDYLREEIDFVEYVRDRTDADVHVLVTRAETGSRGREYALAFIGLAQFAGTDRTLSVTSDATESEDRIRRGLASALTIGLLNYLALGRVPPELGVEVTVAGASGPASAADDPWNRWVFSFNGDVELQAEQSTRQRSFGLEVSADRITPDWKATFGVEFDHSREQFDLDEEQPFTSVRRNRELNWLVVKGLGEHWSVGALGELESSTFQNTELAIEGGPALEWNFFPYSMYTRRQLRILYAVGARRAKYYEETLFGRVDETRGGQSLAGTYEQREPWGTLEGRLEWSNFFPGFDIHRVTLDSGVRIRIVRGWSVSVEATASRIRDQLSLPRRNATPEEVLLRLRQLRSDYQFNLSVGVTYQFGSAFASIVNPRFGQ